MRKERKKKLGLKNILAIPQMYTLWQKSIGDYKLRKIYCREYIKAKEGDRILDIGCGPANMVEYLPKNIDYKGFDDSKFYIENAKKKFPQNNYSFFCQRVNFAKDFGQKFDIIMANAILHHIDDEEAQKLLSFASRNLKPGGRLITHDGCFIDNQSKFKKWVLENDRGKFVRTKEGYFKLFSKHFDKINTTIREDLYNLPYTVIVFECVKS